MIGAAVFQGLLGVALVLFGHWGRTSAGQLVPVALDPEDREAKARVYRRCARGCTFVGTLFIVVSLVVGATSCVTPPELVSSNRCPKSGAAVGHDSWNARPQIRRPISRSSGISQRSQVQPLVDWFC